MKLKEVLKNIEYVSINYDDEIEVGSICLKDSDCYENSMFVSIKGRKNLGNDFIKKAMDKGAKVILTEEFDNNYDVCQIKVGDLRKTLNAICSNFYDHPQKKLKKIAVVGTNGKTTVCELITKILNSAGIKCGKIGTLGAEFALKSIDTGFTTPDTPTLYSLMRQMVDNGVEVLCMELSAHAIYYKKADFKFDIAVFTNCTPEHLDFFKDFEEYRSVKLSAFSSKKVKLAVVNGDDLLGKQIACIRGRGVITYGIEDPADIFVVDYVENENGMEFLLNLFDSLYEIKNSSIGKFNLYNFLAVATTCALLGAKTQFIASELCKIVAVKGRMEKVCDSVKVFIDYAHTPDGLKNALETLKGIKGEKRLICLFGCGGNRDKIKREIMGEISGKYADFTVITSDNPRFEDEMDIIKQIEKGIRGVTRNYIVIRDRAEAINYAVKIAERGDFVLVAGKGAEEYQEQMGVLRRFSDKEQAQSAVKNKYGEL